MKKRAQSGVITAVLLIVIVIVSVVIVWNVVYSLTKKSTDTASSTDMITTNIELKQTKLFVTGGAQINVYRGAGEGTISSLKFIFESKDGERKIVTRTENITELAQKNFVFTNSEIGLNNSDIKSIYLSPVFGTKIGKEVSENTDAYGKDPYGNRILEAKSDSGLVSWWKLDGNYQDSVGGNHGSCTNCPISTTDNKGNANSAMSFTDPKYILVKSSPSLELSSTGTLLVWIKPSSATQEAYAGLISKSISGNVYSDTSYSLVYRTMEGVIAGKIFNTVGSNAVNNSLITDSNWHHLAFSFSGSQLNMYHNSILVSSTTQNIIANINSAHPLKIGGCAYNCVNDFFNGTIDNVMVFNRSLSAEEIQTIYSNQK